MSNTRSIAPHRWRRAVRRGLLAAALLATGAAGAAEWKRYETDHFTIYTRARAANAEEFATRLELLRWLTLRLIGKPDAGPSPAGGRRTEVYMTEGQTIGLVAIATEHKGSMIGTLRRGDVFDCLMVRGLSAHSLRADLVGDLRAGIAAIRAGRPAAEVEALITPPEQPGNKP